MMHNGRVCSQNILQWATFFFWVGDIYANKRSEIQINRDDKFVYCIQEQKTIQNDVIQRLLWNKNK